MTHPTLHGIARHQGKVTHVQVRGGEAVPLAGPPWEHAAPAPGTKSMDVAALEWLAPVRPSKIVAIGRNYVLHAKEHGAEVPKAPLIFLKAPSSLLPHGGDVVLPPESAKVEFEGEIALVFSRRVRRFRRGDDLASVVLGYLPADDVTARDLQAADGQWARAKSFDTFCPVGPFVCAGLPDPDAALTTRVDGVQRQSGRLSEMVFDLATLVAAVSAAMTLEPGDLLLTGTPAGVGPLAPGSRVVIEVAGAPPLSHGVRSEAEQA